MPLACVVNYLLNIQMSELIIHQMTPFFHYSQIMGQDFHKFPTSLRTNWWGRKSIGPLRIMALRVIGGFDCIYSCINISRENLIVTASVSNLHYSRQRHWGHLLEANTVGSPSCETWRMLDSAIGNWRKSMPLR